MLETEQKQQQHQEEEDEAEEDEIVYEDDLLEDEGDYNASYFDPGDEYNDGDDGGDGNCFMNFICLLLFHLFIHYILEPYF